MPPDTNVVFADGRTWETGVNTVYMDSGVPVNSFLQHIMRYSLQYPLTIHGVRLSNITQARYLTSDILFHESNATSPEVLI